MDSRSLFGIHTIVAVDLSCYTEIARKYQSRWNGAQGVARLNQNIRNLIDTTALQLSPDAKKMTGDGAILAFRDAANAYRFSVSLHGLAQRANSIGDNWRYFRIGIATGELILEQLVSACGQPAGYEQHGLIVSDASRLESCCATGEILVDRNTWCVLDAPVRDRMRQVTVRGKRQEQYTAFRERVVASAPWEVNYRLKMNGGLD